MKNFNTKKIIRALLVIACLAFSLFIGFIISINLIVDPIIYWLASTEGARIFISCILSWFGVSTLFDLFYKRYWRSKRLKRFNALNIPYPRTFKGRKWVLKKLNNAHSFKILHLFFWGRLSKYIKIVERNKWTKCP